jgi:hypothetical protein
MSETPSVDHQPPLPSKNRRDHYQQRAQEVLDRFGNDFDGFVTGLESLVKMGDYVLSHSEATGYNIILSPEDMPIASAEPLLFYSNYTGRPEHFGLLLEAMEHNGIVSEDQIRFGKKASKVRYGGWPLIEVDEKVDIVKTVVGEEASGIEGETIQVSKTVELVVLFSPQNQTQALQITAFLAQRASLVQPNAIPGSWDVPDVRATMPLSETLQAAGFKLVEANILSLRGSQLVIARQETAFPIPWEQLQTTMNQELANYLVGFGVNP